MFVECGVQRGLEGVWGKISEDSGLVLKLYRERFGVIPVEVGGDFGPLDVAAALSSDGTVLTVAVVNPSEEAESIDLKLTGGEFAGAGRKWVLTGADKWSHNAPGKPRQVDIRQSSITESAGPLEAGGLSVTLCSYSLR